METLEQLQGRARTAEELLSVVKTMKNLAAANIRDYEGAVASLDRYSTTVEQGFRILLRLQPGAFGQEPGPMRAAPVSLVIIGSDQGMVGRFNEEIAAHARARLPASAANGPVRAIVVGSRLGHVLDEDGVRIDTVIDVPASVEGMVPRVEEVLVRLEKWTRTQPAGEILLVHHRPVGKAAYQPVQQMLLPIDAAWLRELCRDPWPYRGIPAFTVPEPTLLRALVRQYLLISLQRALAQSLAAENGKRLAAMQAAEKNVMERLELLRARYRRRRQTLITAELLEVIAGFEVLESETSDTHHG